MMLSSFWNETWTAHLVNHLWQSTVVAFVAWLLAMLLRNNHARTRYWVWMIASIKFLFPFSLLILAGGWLRLAVATAIQTPAFAAAMEQMTEPFSQATATVAVVPDHLAVSSATHTGNMLPMILPLLCIAAWLCGLLIVAVLWVRGWLRIHKIVRASTRIAWSARVPVLSSPERLEPGVFGIIRPVLLLPEGIHKRLTPDQLGTIVAHEMCHVRRRDNLTAVIHSVVEALFWFHPVVWWIRARLLEERERACDEAVLQSGNKPELYAESILNVCKFYIESPLTCVSGVTGSNLKLRIVRIMEERMGNKLNFTRKLLLGVTAMIALGIPVVFGLVHIKQVNAQTANSNLAQDIADTWQGTLHAGKDLRTVLKITKTDGGYKADFYSIDQSGQPLPVTKITLEGGTVKYSITAFDLKYEGKLSADGKTIVGTSTQGSNSLPLTFARATPETAWAIPEPPPVIPPMAANANPSFEVATIKPSKPDTPGKMFSVQGRRFTTVNTTLSDIISYAYGIHSKQLIGAPAWVETDKFDVEAQPDGEGAPSDKQWKIMWQKLLADRFKLSFHRDKRELSVYVLSVSKTGQKLTKSEGDPNGLPGLWFRGLGKLNVRNATMEDFAGLMQSAVLDRPVLNQTALPGRWDFILNWTPDDSQFASFGVKIPPPTDAANAPPALYTAIQEQIGLKLDATKAAADVFVVDHVEKPSDN
jgi:uncharacterized protein (TIGR03435 family)